MEIRMAIVPKVILRIPLCRKLLGGAYPNLPHAMELDKLEVEVAEPKFSEVQQRGGVVNAAWGDASICSLLVDVVQGRIPWEGDKLKLL